MKITSTANEYIKNLKSLMHKKERDAAGLALVCGKKLCLEALKANLLAEVIYTTEYADVICAPGIKQTEVNEKIIKHLSMQENPQGIIGVIRISSAHHFTQPKTNFIVLDDVQDPGNLGAILRSAAAFGFQSVYAINGADLFNEKVLRSAMGAVFKINYYKIDYAQLASLAKQNILYAADMQGQNIKNIQLNKTKQTGIVIGNEGSGISAQTKEIVKNTISIPMLNGVESLNAAVSAGIILYLIKEAQ